MASRYDAKSWQAIHENRGTLKQTLHSQCTHQRCNVCLLKENLKNPSSFQQSIDHGLYSIELHVWRSAERPTFATFVYRRSGERLLRYFTGSDEDESHLASAEIVRAEFVN